MFDASAVWRVVCAMLVVWLSVQSAVVGLVPAWGAFVAHSHLVTGAVTQADWDAHEHAHHFGLSAHDAYEAACAGPNTPAGRVFALLPATDAVTSWLPALAATLNAHPLKIPACNFPSVRVLAHTYAMRDRFDPPLKPPPNAFVGAIDSTKCFGDNIHFVLISHVYHTQLQLF